MVHALSVNNTVEQPSVAYRAGIMEPPHREVTNYLAPEDLERIWREPSMSRYRVFGKDKGTVMVKGKNVLSPARFVGVSSWFKKRRSRSGLTIRQYRERSCNSGSGGVLWQPAEAVCGLALDLRR